MSELLNIWREVGSYNRFAETKLIFFIGLAVTLIGFQGMSPTAVSLPMAIIRGGSSAIMTIGASVSVVIAAAALIPRLSSRALFTPILLRTQIPNTYFFVSIATFGSGSDWLKASTIPFSDQELVRANLLAEQIYAISSITVQKFTALRLGLTTLLVTWLLSWVVPWSLNS